MHLHLQLWQSLFKLLPSDMTLFQFLADLNIVAASFFTPDDAYIAQLCGAVEAINAGVTTVLDHYHLANSVEHVHSGLEASQHSGLRSVFAMGTNQRATFPLAEKRAAQLNGQAENSTNGTAPQKELAFGDAAWQLQAFRDLAAVPAHAEATTTIGLALDRWKKMGGAEVNEFTAAARTAGCTPITLHVSNGVLNGKTDEPLLAAPLHDILGPDVVLSHANMLTARELSLAAARGVKLSATPEVEHHLNMGPSIVRRGEAHGCCVGLGTDTTALVEGSMFGVVRASLAELRLARNAELAGEDHFPRHLKPSTHTAFLRATVGGAEVLGRSSGASAVGRLEAGCRADIVLLNGRSPNMLGALWQGRDAVAAAVTQASIADVDSVLINGRLLKSNGHLHALSPEALLALRAIASRANIAVDAKDDGHDLLQRLAENSAKAIAERGRHVDLDAVRKQMGGFLGVNARLV